VKFVNSEAETCASDDLEPVSVALSLQATCASDDFEPVSVALSL